MGEKMIPTRKGERTIALLCCIIFSVNQLVSGEDQMHDLQGQHTIEKRSLGPLNFFSYLERKPDNERFRPERETVESLEQSLLRPAKRQKFLQICPYCYSVLSNQLGLPPRIVFRH